jgi:hypothetical protein
MGTECDIQQDRLPMIRNNAKITSLVYGDMVESLAKHCDITMEQARKQISEMSFIEYRALEEATLVQPSNSFSTVKPTYPNPIQAKQTREPTPDSDSPEQFGGLTDPHTTDQRADKIAAARDRQATIQHTDQPGQSGVIQTGRQQNTGLTQEDITPPSGDTVGPGSTSGNTTGSLPTSSSGASADPSIKSLWPGKGIPPQVGMTVGLKGPSGLPVPGQITQVDSGAKGAKIKNPTTGQEEWTNIDMLQPYMAGGQKQAQPAAPTQPTLTNPQQTMEEELNRMRQLAGIQETCSAGATGAGAIATAPMSMGTIKRRPQAIGELNTEYRPKEAAKTIIGDTKPNQATGKLSADLAATGKPAAGRTNVGRRRR